MGFGCLGGSVVRRRTRDRKVAGSTPGRGAIKSTRSTQPSIPPGYVNQVPACMAGVRRGAFTCVGRQVTLRDPIWQVTSRSSEMGCHEELYRPLLFFTFGLTGSLPLHLYFISSTVWIFWQIMVTWFDLTSATNILKHYWRHICLTRPQGFVTFYISASEILLLTCLLTYLTGARKPPRVRRRVARCVSPYSTDSNYEGPDTAPRRRPQRRRQPRHQQGTSTATSSAATTGDARTAAPGDTQPSPANSARPRPPPIAAKPRGMSLPLTTSMRNFLI